MMKNVYDCGALLKQINDIMERNVNNTLRKEGLTLTQSGVLISLDQKECKRATFKELEKEFNVSQPTMLGIIKRLEQKNYLEILCDDDDKRIKIAKLTDSSKEKCKVGYKHMEDSEKFLLQSLSKSEQSDFSVLLKKVRDSII